MRLISPIFLALAATAAADELPAAPIVQAIAPNATKCPETKECRTAEQAAPFIADSMAYNNITSPREMAAIISLMAFESVDFKYKHNMFPGRPGQGTANMQMAEFNLEYAKSLPAVKDKVADIPTVQGQSNETLNMILSLVQDDKYNFGSGPWYFNVKCADARAAFQKDLEEGFQAYMKCVGVEVTDDRKPYWERAKKAFKLS